MEFIGQSNSDLIFSTFFNVHFAYFTEKWYSNAYVNQA